MIEIIDKKKCCGCTACASACPKKCINMVEDNEGFLYPQVTTSECVDCGLCDKVCPILNCENEKENPQQQGVVIANKNERVLKQSTSGGAFTAIAEYVIKQGGVVFGVEMDINFHVHHTETQLIDDIEKFRNSKYVQSDLNYTYITVKKYLEQDRLVCFSGTPCQIEGLRHYLRKQYKNLILVDVVCRAVPSPGVWKRYVKLLESRYGKIDSIRFRDKTLGYQYSTMMVKSEDGFIDRNGIESDSWLRMFFSGMIIRPSCTECHFRKRYRNSDITIWDCFNVSDISKIFDETKGATRMLIHTSKGEKIFNDIKSNYYYQMVKPDVLVEGLTELSKSPQEHKRKKDFFLDYSVMPMDELLNKYFPNTYMVKFKKYGRLALNKMGVDMFVKRLKRRLQG